MQFILAFILGYCGIGAIIAAEQGNTLLAWVQAVLAVVAIIGLTVWTALDL